MPMADLKDCKKYADCDWRKSVGYCLDECNNFKHKDEVVVIRCKDCKKWNEETGWCDEHSQFYEHGMYWDIFAEEDFCSYGEGRK